MSTEKTLEQLKDEIVQAQRLRLELDSTISHARTNYQMRLVAGERGQDPLYDLRVMCGGPVDDYKVLVATQKKIEECPIGEWLLAYWSFPLRSGQNTEMIVFGKRTEQSRFVFQYDGSLPPSPPGRPTDPTSRYSLAIPVERAYVWDGIRGVLSTEVSDQIGPFIVADVEDEPYIALHNLIVGQESGAAQMYETYRFLVGNKDVAAWAKRQHPSFWYGSIWSLIREACTVYL